MQFPSRLTWLPYVLLILTFFLRSWNALAGPDHSPAKIHSALGFPKLEAAPELKSILLRSGYKVWTGDKAIDAFLAHTVAVGAGPAGLDTDFLTSDLILVIDLLPDDKPCTYITVVEAYKDLDGNGRFSGRPEYYGSVLYPYQDCDFGKPSTLTASSTTTSDLAPVTSP